MPIKPTGGNEEYLFSEYSNGASIWGIKDTGNPVALGMVLAPFTLGASLIAGLTESSTRKNVNAMRKNQKYRRDYVGKVLEKNSLGFNDKIENTNLKQKDISVDFVCPFCEKKVIESFSINVKLKFYKIKESECIVCKSSFYYYLGKPDILVVIKNYRCSDWEEVTEDS